MAINLKIIPKKIKQKKKAQKTPARQLKIQTKNIWSSLKQIRINIKLN